MPRPTVLIALGGNAISRPGEVGDLGQQYKHTAETMVELTTLLEDGIVESFILTHGNGPQVGNIILRSELATSVLYPLSIDVCVSDSEGGMGYMLQQVLHNCLRDRGIVRPVVTLITQIVVDPKDTAFSNPTKYIGQFLTKEDAEERAATRGWKVKEDKGRGWRRVVPSPDPQRIVELDSIRALYKAGAICIAAGGGGIPVIEDEKGHLVGVEGVIDKDLASALLASSLGIETMVIMTGENGIFSDYKGPNQKHYPKLTASELRSLQAAGQFPAGSMGPKVEASLRFIDSGGHRVIIAENGKMAAALRGETGTQILPG